jgi:hypothetical protein
MKQFTGLEIFGFEKKFRNNEFPNERYGQAFCNHFSIENFSELFYMEDDKLARMTAWFNFLKEDEE